MMKTNISDAGNRGVTSVDDGILGCGGFVACRKTRKCRPNRTNTEDAARRL